MFKKRTQKPAPRARMPRTEPQANKVFSYYSVKRPSEIEEIDRPSARQNRDEGVAKTTRFIFLKRLGVLAVFILIIFIFIANVRLNPNDMQVTLKGTPEERLLLQDEAVYKESAQKIMEEKLQNRIKLSFDGKAFSQAMVRQYPEIATVNAALPLVGGKTTLYIEPSPVALVFMSQDKKAYVMDKNGKIISASINNVRQGVPVVTDQSGIEPKIGTQILPSGDVYAIQTILYQLKEKNIAAESLVLPTAAQRLEVRLAGKPYYIKFNLHENVMQQVGAYLAVQQKLDREGTQPKEYIDVRVADRVYYK